MKESIKQEILRRYTYLYDNKELILSLCIKEGIEEKHYKQCIKELKSSLKRFRKDGFKSQKLRDVFKDIENRYRQDLKNPKLYLMDDIDEKTLSMLEEFLISDKPLEESLLYKEIEQIKKDELEMAQAEYLIEGLNERRKNNQHLKNRNPFTVWRILNYVRENNTNIDDIQDYLDIYYNLDRYINTDLEWQSGYYLSESDYTANEDFISSNGSLDIVGKVHTEYEDSAIITEYKGNEFEKEDEYYEQFPTYQNTQVSKIGLITNFVYEAIWEGFIPTEDKIKLRKKLKGQSKKYVY